MQSPHDYDKWKEENKEVLKESLKAVETKKFERIEVTKIKNAIRAELGFIPISENACPECDKEGGTSTIKIVTFKDNTSPTGFAIRIIAIHENPGFAPCIKVGSPIQNYNSEIKKEENS
jgi:hypothetical protein